MNSPDPSFVKTVPIKTIDTFLDELGVDKVDLISENPGGASSDHSRRNRSGSRQPQISQSRIAAGDQPPLD